MHTHTMYSKITVIQFVQSIAAVYTSVLFSVYLYVIEIVPP